MRLPRVSHEFGSPVKPQGPQGAVLRLQRKALLGAAQLLPVLLAQLEQPLLGAAEGSARWTSVSGWQEGPPVRLGSESKRAFNGGVNRGGWLDH